MMKECAIVPTVGIPSLYPASAFEVPTQPPIEPALAAKNAACGPCARRDPNSMMDFPLAEVTILDALDAIRLWKLIIESMYVSTIYASIIGASILMIGSLGNRTVPSGTAHTVPVNLNLFKYPKKLWSAYLKVL